jgi:hypothetical protein
MNDLMNFTARCYELTFDDVGGGTSALSLKNEIHQFIILLISLTFVKNRKILKCNKELSRDKMFL